MGFVYRARDKNLETDVVIKVPRPEMLVNPRFAGRFAREVRSLVRLSHPHIVKVMDVGEHGRVPFVVLQSSATASRLNTCRQAAPPTCASPYYHCHGCRSQDPPHITGMGFLT